MFTLLSEAQSLCCSSFRSDWKNSASKQWTPQQNPVDPIISQQCPSCNRFGLTLQTYCMYYVQKLYQYVHFICIQTLISKRQRYHSGTSNSRANSRDISFPHLSVSSPICFMPSNSRWVNDVGIVLYFY